MLLILLFLPAIFAWHSTCSGGKGYNTYDVHGCFNRVNVRPNFGSTKNNIDCFMSSIDHKCKDPSEQEFDKAAGDLNYWCNGRQSGENYPDCNNWHIQYEAF
jgi:hypothetical protein